MASASPSSIDGLLYTKIPMWYHLMGLPEIMLQTLVFSIWLVWWERQAAGDRETTTKTENHLVAEVVRAAATGTGGIDIEAAGASFKMQFMFVVAFLVNAVTVFWIALGVAFVLFWFLDAAVPWLYQTLVFRSSFIPTAILLGLLPAAIIVLGIKMNYRQFAMQARR